MLFTWDNTSRENKCNQEYHQLKLPLELGTPETLRPRENFCETYSTNTYIWFAVQYSTIGIIQVSFI